MTAPASPVLSIPEAAAYIGVTPQTMRRLVAASDMDRRNVPARGTARA
jgi:hypothetical protein